jgi:hypothetical protein
MINSGSCGKLANATYSKIELSLALLIEKFQWCQNSWHLVEKQELKMR